MKYPIQVLIYKIKFEISLLELENHVMGGGLPNYQRDSDILNQILEILENQKGEE